MKKLVALILLIFLYNSLVAQTSLNFHNGEKFNESNLEKILGDELWSDKFHQNGVNGIVHAIAVAPNGDIYVGGDFREASKVKVNAIARWNGSQWSDVGGGVSNSFNTSIIRDMIFVGNDLYVVGSFSKAGNVTAINIAKWDGTNWSAVGNGVGDVRTIGIYQNELYIGGGPLLIPNDTTIKSIAKWDGSNFVKVGDGIGDNAYVNSLAVINNELYIGGSFSAAGNVSVNNLAKWNGSSWSDVGGGVTGSFPFISSIRAIGNELYVCGKFDQAGGITAKGIAKWNGNSWTVFGDGLGSSSNYAYDIAVMGSDIYVTGNIQYGTVYGHLVKWNGTSWQEVGGGLSRGGSSEPYGRRLAVKDNDLYVGGNFRQAGGVAARFFARWNGTSFFPIHENQGKGLNKEVNAIAVAPNGDIYVGGKFFPDAANGFDVPNRIAKWDGNNWIALGSGVNNDVNAITITNNGDVYVGGNFTSAGGTNARYIAKWNGTTWSTVGGTINSEVKALTTDGVNVYAAVGYSVFKWDGTSWTAIGSAFNNRVLAIAVKDNSIYAGGRFTSVGSLQANYLAKWDGNSWSQIGDIPTGTVEIRTLAIDNSNNLYFGGYFFNLGSIQVMGVAKWNGTTIEPLGSGLVPGVSGQCYTMTFDENGNLLVGGRFAVAGDTSIHANNIAKWNGTEWSVFGSGLSGNLGLYSGTEVYALATKGTEIFVGGSFTSAGNKPAYGFSIYNSATVGVNDQIKFPNEYKLYQNYPNPFNPITKISFQLPVGGHTRLKVYDILGKEIATLVDEYKNAGSYEVEFNAGQTTNLSSGVYFYKLHSGNNVQIKKMILIK